MWEKFRLLWKTPDVRKNILVILALLAFFRLMAHIPVPGVNAAALKSFFSNSALLGLLNTFTGGGLENLSVVMLGVGPYITASIIFQLLGMVVPSLEALMKEGEAGQRKINQYTKLATVPLALIQGYSTIAILRSSAAGVFDGLTTAKLIGILITVTAGSMLLLWIGELITERKLGNGVSLLIFAGIIASMPSQIGGIVATYDPSQLINVVLFIAIAVGTVFGIVFITEGQRNIPVSYARRIRGNRVFGGVNTYLPLRVNQAGVIPIIFALSFLLFPPVVAQFLVQNNVSWISNIGQTIVNVFQNQTFYGVMYFLLVVGFTYFYTAVIFHPTQLAENLQKQGGFIPGIRPGSQTAEYVGKISNRIMLAGALFLGIIAIIPLVVQQSFGWQLSVVGGTSILIVVSVVIETMKALEAQVAMRDYDEMR